MIEKSGIYKITSPSGKIYIGSAALIKRRWALHTHQLKHGTHHNKPLQMAAKKYGLDALKFEILFLCDTRDLLFYEQRTIDAMNPEYNTCKKAGSILGTKLTEEHKEKIAASKRGRKTGPQTKEHVESRMSKIRGIKRTKEHLEKLSAYNVGKKLSADEIARRTETRHKKGYISPEARERMTAGIRAYHAAKKAGKTCNAG